MPWRPAEHERAEYRGDGTQRLASTILLVLLHLRGPSDTADVLRTSLYSQPHATPSRVILLLAHSLILDIQHKPKPQYVSCKVECSVEGDDR